MSTPACTAAPPIQLASSGLSAGRGCRVSRSAVKVGSVMFCGVRITSRPSVDGSAAASSSARE
jgi:hypothetical protein